MKLKTAIITLFTIFTSSILLADTIDILYNSDTPIAGFQFNVDGVEVTGASGGAAEAEGFMVSSSATTVIGFSLNGSTIPAGEDVLTVLEIEGDAADACLADLIMSDADGIALDATLVNCLTITIMAPVSGCMDMDACNYNADATEDDGSCSENDCAGVCDGPAMEDCAGDCDGTALVDMCGTCDSDAANDCEQDCAGEWGGDAVLSGCDNVCNSTAVVDECGVCDGDGPGICWDGTTQCDPADCPDLPVGSVEVYYSTDVPIAGFQFDVDGVDVTAVSGGAAEAEGFSLSTGNNTVLGFSLTGAIIPVGSGVLVVLDVEGDVTAACLSEVIISDSDADTIDATVVDCLTLTITGPVPGCMDMDACNYNADATEDDGSCLEDDCAGECGGTAVVDMCDTCDSDPDNDCEQDCAGEWGGDAVLSGCDDACNSTAVVDECGVCDGDGPGMCWDGTSVCDASDCPGGTVEILYSTDVPMAGFQFDVDGVEVIGASGGAAGDQSFTVSTGNNTVIGFSMTGTWIPAGAGVLVVLDVIGDVTAACVLGSELFISDADGVALDSSVEECLTITSTAPVLGCMDVDACNYNADATEEDGSCLEDDCAGECGGTAVVDMCDTCDSDADNDCVEDCAGEWGGDAALSGCDNACNSTAELDECGVCDGYGANVECWDSSMVCDEADCPIFNWDGEACTMFDNSIHLRGDGAVLYNTLEPIAGFQFDVDGAAVLDASGGDSEEAGFMISASETTVLGFSLDGSTIDGCGTMINLELDGMASGMSGIIISDAGGIQLPITYFDYEVECSSGYYDCYGICDGSAMMDDCGECGGSGVADACDCTDTSGLNDDGCCDDAVVDDCGVCDGDGANVECWDSSMVCDEADCPIFNWDGEACTMFDNSIHLGSDGAVLYNTLDPVAGFQFDVDGAAILDASGGDSEEAGFMISASETTVLGFSLDGSTIDGCGTMINLELDGMASGLSGIIISDANGIELTFTYFDHEVASLGCMDMDACNYNADATVDDGSCLENDCAGECGGDSVLSGCDNLCNSTAVEDCAGVCDGTAELDDCTTPVCSGGTTELVANASCTDCNSEINGTALVDMCEVCDSDATNDCVQDCALAWGGDSWESGCGCVAVDNSGDDCDDYCGEPNGGNSTCSSYPPELTVEGWSAVSLSQYDETCSGEATASTSGPFDLSGYSCESLSITFTDDGTFSGSCALTVPVPVSGTWVVYNSDMLCLMVGADEECATYSYSSVDGSFGLSGLGDDGNCYETVFQLTSTLAIDEYGIPAEFTVYQNYPNPFNPSTVFEFDVATPTNVSLLIYDLTGKEVYSLASGYHVPGRYSVGWNAIDYNGQSVSSGMYIYQLRTSDALVTKKLVLLR